MRSQGLVKHGWQLPESVPYVVYIRHVDDCDAPAVSYPSCCVLAPGGFSCISHAAGSSQDGLVLKQLAGMNLLFALSAARIIHEFSLRGNVSAEVVCQGHA